MKVGVDMIEIERVRRALERPGFRERCFTDEEREYCDSRHDPAESYAARFAGKEAVGKALGCGVRFTWRDVEIVGRPKPSVRLSGRTAAYAEKVRAGAIDLSMTHSREMAAAICVVSPLDQMLEPLYTAAEMRVAEERYPGYPETIPELMQRAGRAVAREAMAAYPAARRFACVCGTGSNGGDGRVAAAALRENGLAVDETFQVDGYDVVVDALFGTGFHGEPRPDAAELIERINGSGATVVSVDLPSGVDASTGEVAGAVVDADLTVTFHGSKVGLAVGPGRFHAGKVVVADIGLKPVETEHSRATTALLELVPRRGTGDTKYSAGSVLVVGGQPGMTGAACLSALAALRADAGYVTLAVPARSLPVVESLALEPVKVGWRDDRAVETIAAAAERAGALAIGPGLGRTPKRRAVVRELLERVDLPAVVDADALFGFKPVSRAAPTVLTPHAGELARLLGTESSWVGAHRLEAARNAAERFGAVVLLKGADTIVAAPGEGCIVCDFGPPSLATAGTGDVLTGIVASFLSKGVEPRLAAAAAAVAHGTAAALTRHRTGLIAGDLLDLLPAALEQ